MLRTSGEDANQNGVLMTPQKKNTPDLRIPIQAFARGMRLDPTSQEDKLYSALLLAFDPYKATVHSQEPIGPFVADFLIAPCNIVIEVDGGYHFDAKQKRSDRRRDTFMRNKGLRIMRFRNDQIDRNPKACAQYILSQCLPLPPFTERTKVTFCPPVDGRKKQSKVEKRLFWRS